MRSQPSAKRSAAAPSQKPAFDLRLFLHTSGIARQVVKFRKSQTIYAQGDLAKGVKYIQKGQVKLSVANAGGKEAVIAIWERATSSARDAWRASRFAWAQPRRWQPRPYYSLKNRR
jgi:CRP-like cAMP-binding protein